jgi:hypothetical protein
MRRGVSADAIAGRAVDRGQQDGAGTFAVGAGDGQGPRARLQQTEAGADFAYAFEAKRDRARMQTFLIDKPVAERAWTPGGCRGRNLSGQRRG